MHDFDLERTNKVDNMPCTCHQAFSGDILCLVARPNLIIHCIYKLMNISGFFSYLYVYLFLTNAFGSPFDLGFDPKTTEMSLLKSKVFINLPGRPELDTPVL